MNQLPLWGGSTARRSSIKLLSKSRVTAGLQCPKRLYLECYESEKRDPIDPGRQALFDAGRQVGEVARGRFPGGVRMEEDPLLHDKASRDTAAAMANPATRAVYEAAFTFGDIRVRVDILARDGSAWDLIEVKSSTGFKEEYLADIAVQAHVVRGSGVALNRACLLHVNNQYTWRGGPYDLDSLFAIQDLTEAAWAAVPSLLEKIEEMREPLWATEPPPVPVGPHCEKPYRCPFFDHCHADGPEHPITDLPRLTPKLYRTFAEASIEEIGEIPEDFDGLSELQRRVRDCVVRGEPFTHPALVPALQAIRHPIHFLDFETCNPALPIIPGTRPFQQMPFQYSDHVLEEDGTLHHRGYLHPDRSDPRPRLAEELIEAIDGEGSIVVYSGFEARVIRSLAEAIPKLHDRLLPLVEHRMVDLHHLIHEHYYHPKFRGSFSIKGVLPVLVEGLDYRDLTIKEGSQAAGAFMDMTNPATPAAKRDALREGLLAYCHRDTEAMVRLFQTLKEVT